MTEVKGCCWGRTELEPAGGQQGDPELPDAHAEENRLPEPAEQELGGRVNNPSGDRDRKATVTSWAP